MLSIFQYIYITGSFDSLEYNLHIDALSLVNLNVNSAELHAILVESTCRNIRMIEILQEGQSEDIRLPEIMHFKPHDCGHLYTIVYPGSCNSTDTGKISHVSIVVSLSVIGHAISFSSIGSHDMSKLLET